MLPVVFQLILYYGLLVVHGVRVDLHTGAEADVANGPTHHLEVAEKLHRYRALNETLMNRYMAGADIPLVDSSFLEDDITSYHLPRQWRKKLQVVKKLGEGSFGKVFQCRVLCESSKDVSVSVKLIVDKDDPQVRNEIQILKQMRGVSEFCISAVGEPPYIENSDGIWLMMPYMNGGELLDFLNRCQTSPGCLYGDPEGRKDWTQLNPLYTTPYILGLFSDIVQGVEALHAKAGRLHIDLKPANVMLNCRGEKCFAAVIDLGLACDPTISQDCRASGTPIYLPPEVYRLSRRGLRHPARDVWALGIILYQLLYRGRPPFFSDPRHQVSLYDAYSDDNIPKTRKVDSLVMAMLNRDYHSRPTLQGIRTALKALVYEDYALDRDAVNMIKLSPSERGASVTTPTCLDREEEPMPAPQWNAVHPSGQVKYNPADFAPDRHQASTTLQRVFRYDDVREQVITTSQSPVHRPVLHYDHVYDEPVEGYHPADLNAPGFRPGRRPRQPYDPARYQALLESEAKTHELP